ncbi:phosphate ABC transporter substrate-binding/OmpA family protein [Pseudomonas sp. RIT-PI-AD]|uniref:phosphate ABC transporter substrate-binding/OmpA family protein n=1 Tax=Pseudomonas sp. RIT-PI-AD TaxID=3035294 RepID=UPI0021D8E04A|nr:phosphate ABC transporter substrate-binding/OmpA family protein [Pseudomonas sp. RIT-PI-AD]
MTRALLSWPTGLRRLALGLFLGSLFLPSPRLRAAPLPIPADGSPLLRIQGSNTLGAKLGPALVRGLLEEQGLVSLHEEAVAENEWKVSGRDVQGREAWVQVAAHGSGTGFTALLAGSAELAASSRPIKDSEALALAGAGDMRTERAEQVVAIDGLAIIVHPGNPLASLDSERLARIFAGEAKTWEELGGQGGAIHLYVRDERSGTYDTFKELVLATRGKALAASARRYESSDKLAASVALDPQGIGFVGVASVGAARALDLADGPARAMPPSTALIATEDYPLSRRLYFYIKPGEPNPWAQALINFAQSPRGQALVAQNGFVAQTLQAIESPSDPRMPATYRRLAGEARRLSVNFRFQEGSASLDNKARQDVQRLVDYLGAQGKLQGRVALVGFGDAKTDPQRATLLSKLRAMAVRRELARGGVVPREVMGLGDELPVAANDDGGRYRNRRVEVWLY